MEEARIYRSLTLQKMDLDQGNRCSLIRDQAKELAKMIDVSCGDSREKSLAFTNLEQSLMWAIKAIALEGE